MFNHPNGVIREVKLEVYGKRQTAKIKLLPSVFSSLYSRIKIFVFAVNSKRHFYFCMIYLKDNMKTRIEKQRKYLPSAVNVRLKLSNITSVFTFFSCYPEISHTKIEVSLTIHCKYKCFDSAVQRAEDRL